MKLQQQKDKIIRQGWRIQTFPSRITSSPSTHRGFWNPGSASLPSPL